MRYRYVIFCTVVAAGVASFAWWGYTHARLKISVLSVNTHLPGTLRQSVNQLPELLCDHKKPRDHGRLRPAVAWSCMAIVASPLVTGCGARSEIPTPPPGYVVLFPTSAGGENVDTQTLSLWHSRTKTISTVGTYTFEQATMSFDGRFIAVEHCAAGACAGGEAALDVIAPDGTIVWSQSETTGQTPWGWLGALRPDGQRVLVATIPDDTPLAKFSLCVLDRESTPVPIRTESVQDQVFEASYSPDGKTIVAVHSNSPAQASETVVTMRDDGTQYTTLAGLDEPDAGDGFHAPVFNFDGTAVVYTHIHSPNVQDVVVVDLASHESRIVYSGTQQSWHLGRFTPDGSAIVIQELDETNVETLRHIDLATGEASILWQGHATFDSYISVAADD
jgi:hypothetical protein